MAWEQIEQIDLAAPASSIVFDTGLDGYVFYRLSFYINNNSGANNVLLRFNGDSGANYSYQEALATSSGASATRSTSQSSIEVNGLSIAANNVGSYTLIIGKPASNGPAQVMSLGGGDSAPELALVGGQWDNTADLISEISLHLSGLGDFEAGTSALLEGLAV